MPRTDFFTASPAENILSYTPNDFAGLCQDVERTLRRVIETTATGFEARSILADFQAESPTTPETSELPQLGVR